MIKLIKEFLNNFQDLSQYYDFLINKTKKEKYYGTKHKNSI